MRRLSEPLKIPEGPAKALAAEQHRARSALVRHCFAADIDDPTVYDAAGNTDTVPLAGIASTAVRFIEYKHTEGEKAKPLNAWPART